MSRTGKAFNYFMSAKENWGFVQLYGESILGTMHVRQRVQKIVNKLGNTL